MAEGERNFKKEPLNTLEYRVYPQLYEQWTRKITSSGIDDLIRNAKGNGKGAEQRVKDLQNTLDEIGEQIDRRLAIPNEILNLDEGEIASGMEAELQQELDSIEQLDTLVKAQQATESSLFRSTKVLERLEKGVEDTLVLMRETTTQGVVSVINRATQDNKDNKAKQLAAAVSAVTELMKGDPENTQRKMLKELRDITAGRSLVDIHGKLEQVEIIRYQAILHSGLYDIADTGMLEGTLRDTVRNLVPSDQVLLRVAMAKFTPTTTYEVMTDTLTKEVRSQIQMEREEKKPSSADSSRGKGFAAFHSQQQRDNNNEGYSGERDRDDGDDRMRDSRRYERGGQQGSSSYDEYDEGRGRRYGNFDRRRDDGGDVGHNRAFAAAGLSDETARRFGIGGRGGGGRPRGTCDNWTNNRKCTFGDACRFLHPGGGSGGGSGSGSGSGSGRQSTERGDRDRGRHRSRSRDNARDQNSQSNSRRDRDSRSEGSRSRSRDSQNSEDTKDTRKSATKPDSMKATGKRT